MDFLSLAPRIALEAVLDHIARVSNMIKAAYDAFKSSPSQTGIWDCLTDGLKWLTVWIVSAV